MFSCSHDLCREPRGRKSYVVIDFGAAAAVFCMYCYLVHMCQVDEGDAFDIEEIAEEMTII